MTFIYYVLLTLFLTLSAFLVLLVLIQKGRGGGLASAFGGVGGNTAFGAKTGDVLTWATSIVFGVFLLLAIGLNLIANNLHQSYVDPLAGAQPAPVEEKKDPILPAGSVTPTTVPTATEPSTTQPSATTLPTTQP